MNTLKVLKDARELIAYPTHWIQKDYARTWDDHPIDPAWSEACRFCAEGALMRVAAGGSTWDDTRIPRKALARHTLGLTLIDFNDSHTHADVLAVFDAAIADLEKEAA